MFNTLVYPLGHKNALYQSNLAKKLPYSTFRFDLHGNGDSQGQPGYSHIAVRTTFVYCWLGGILIQLFLKQLI